MIPETVADICVLGLGPAGLGVVSGLLDRRVKGRILLVDAGSDALERTCPAAVDGQCDGREPCAVISGIGGSSLLAGGKLSMLPAGRGLSSIIGSRARTHDAMQRVLDLLRPHAKIVAPLISSSAVRNEKRRFAALGFEFRYYDSYLVTTRGLRAFYESIVERARTQGYQFALNTTVLRIVKDGPELVAMAKSGHQDLAIRIKRALVIAVGRLGHSLLVNAGKDLRLESQEGHLDIGVRLEFPTEAFPDMDRYHNDLKLLEGDTRTFCACKDGCVISYVFEGRRFVEGSRLPEEPTGYSNLAVMIRVQPPKSGAIWSDMIEAPTPDAPARPMLGSLSDLSQGQVGESTARVHTTLGDVQRGNVMSCYPNYLHAVLRDRTIHFASALLSRVNWESVAVLTPEMGVKYPRLRIKSDFSVCPGVHVVGDATGRFRGILQALASGIICAEGLVT